MLDEVLVAIWRAVHRRAREFIIFEFNFQIVRGLLFAIRMATHLQNAVNKPVEWLGCA